VDGLDEWTIVGLRAAKREEHIHAWSSLRKENQTEPGYVWRGESGRRHMRYGLDERRVSAVGVYCRYDTKNKYEISLFLLPLRLLLLFLVNVCRICD
jgi:hypothetical protein